MTGNPTVLASALEFYSSGWRKIIPAKGLPSIGRAREFAILFPRSIPALGSDFCPGTGLKTFSLRRLHIASRDHFDLSGIAPQEQGSRFVQPDGLAMFLTPTRRERHALS